MDFRGLRQRSHRPGIAVGLLWLLAISGTAQVYQVEEMNTEQIQALDRATTVVILNCSVKQGRLAA